MERVIQRAASGRPAWPIAAGVVAGLLLARLPVAPALVPFVLALLAGVAKSGTA